MTEDDSAAPETDDAPPAAEADTPEGRSPHRGADLSVEASHPMPADAAAEPRVPLRPARPEAFEAGTRPDYMPRLPWRPFLLFGGLLALVFGGYQLREEQLREALRVQILRTHDERLSGLAERYRTFRGLIEQRTLEAAQAGEPERWVDPRLRISGLHDGPGVYLRLTLAQARSVEGIEDGARSMGADALVRCLGIAPASARGLYQAGAFLTQAWVDEARATPERIRLRVLDEQLARSVQVDVPAIATLLSAQYFLLVIQQGQSRRDAPVDVYLWDLREDRPLLRARVQGRGLLLPVRLRFDGVAPAPRPETPPSVHSIGAFDCSIAAQIKALTGEAPVSVGSAEEIEARAAQPTAPAEGAASAPGTPAEPHDEDPRGNPTPTAPGGAQAPAAPASAGTAPTP